MKNYVPAILIVIALLSGCSSPEESSVEPDPKSISGKLSLKFADKAVVTYAPTGDFESTDAVGKEILDESKIKRWIQALSKVPADGPGKKIKFAGNSKQYSIKFYRGDKELASLRIFENHLASPLGNGFSFYDGEDKAFVQLVKLEF